MDFSQERRKPLFMEKLPDGSKKFVSIADIKGSKLASPAKEEVWLADTVSRVASWSKDTSILSQAD